MCEMKLYCDVIVLKLLPTVIHFFQSICKLIELRGRGEGVGIFPYKAHSGL